MIQSQNGWMASKDKAEIDIDSFLISGTKVKLSCTRSVAPLLVGFATEFHELIEPIDEGSLDDWGYCYREIRGSQTVLSNHSSGTAIDLNSKIHPLGRAGTFPLAKVPMILALTEKYSLKWGGSYKGRVDEMHWEVAIPKSKLEAAIAKIGKSK